MSFITVFYKIQINIILGLIIFWVISCSQIRFVDVKAYEKIDVPKMPTEYIFDVSQDSMMKVLEKHFNSFRVTEEFKKIWKVKNRKDLQGISFYKYLRRLEEYEFEGYFYLPDSLKQVDDYYLISLPVRYIKDNFLLDAWVRHPTDIAYNYQFEGTDIHPIYKTIFQIKMKEITHEKTQVSIIPINPKIVVGSEVVYNPRILWWQRIAIDKDAVPSTIEEYQILLYIGEILGVKDQMPKLILPKE